MEKFEEVLSSAWSRLNKLLRPAVTFRTRGFGLFLALFRFLGCGEGAVRGEAPGGVPVLPCPAGERRAHRCDPHPRSRWRHELQAPGLSGSLPGVQRRHLPALHLQRLEPGLQSEGLSRRVGENLQGVFLWRHSVEGQGGHGSLCCCHCRTTWGHWRTSTLDTYLLEVRRPKYHHIGQNNMWGKS